MGALHPDILDDFPARQWHVAIVRNHWERSTKEKIDQLQMNVETYVPIQRILRVYCDRRKWVDTVAIPGVLFVSVTDKAALKGLLEQHIPFRLLRTADKKRFAVVPDWEFRRMKDFIERAENEITLEQGLFPKGSTAHIYRGPFKGCKVLVISEDSDTKAKIGIQLEIFNRTLCTTIDKSDLLSDVEWRHTRRLPH